MDIVIFYGSEEYIIELKVWHGEKYHNSGIEQLAGYMDSRMQKKGYMVSFCFNENKEKIMKDYTKQNYRVEKKEIYEIVM